MAAEDGGVGFRRVTVAAGRRVASQEVTFSQQARGEKTGGCRNPQPGLPPHHGSLLLLQARSAISRGAL